ncbi:MAG: hypothetical protein IT462_11665 [Planctomycetes bacterium]|nr:hypothetical protein [Planctomycetota bacterium]
MSDASTSQFNLQAPVQLDWAASQLILPCDVLVLDFSEGKSDKEPWSLPLHFCVVFEVARRQHAGLQDQTYVRYDGEFQAPLNGQASSFQLDTLPTAGTVAKKWERMNLSPGQRYADPRDQDKDTFHYNTQPYRLYLRCKGPNGPGVVKLVPLEDEDKSTGTTCAAELTDRYVTQCVKLGRQFKVTDKQILKQGIYSSLNLLTHLFTAHLHSRPKAGASRSMTWAELKLCSLVRVGKKSFKPLEPRQIKLLSVPPYSAPTAKPEIGKGSGARSGPTRRATNDLRDARLFHAHGADSFLGRIDELAQLERLMLDRVNGEKPRHQVLSIVGGAGHGKSRLVAEAVFRVQEAINHNVWYVALADYPSTVDLSMAAATALKLSNCESNLGAVLARVLGSKEPALIVLDNAEHVLNASATLVRDCVAASGQVQFVVTSRERLAIAGEQAIELRPFPLPETTVPDARTSSSAGELSLPDCVQLFFDRAIQAGVEAHVLRQQVESIADVCRLVEGIPLAIELAAPKATILSVSEIASGLRTSMALLSSEQRDVPGKHRSMFAALEWSWSLLSVEERAFLVQLVVFQGGCTYKAITEIVQLPVLQLGEQVRISTLARLVRAHLVVTQIHQGQSRYRLPRLVWQFARAKLTALPADIETNLCVRYVEHYTQAAETMEADCSQTDKKPYLDFLWSEVGNFQAIIFLGLENPHLHRAAQAADSFRHLLQLSVACLDLTAIQQLGEKVFSRLPSSENVLRQLVCEWMCWAYFGVSDAAGFAHWAKYLKDVSGPIEALPPKDLARWNLVAGRAELLCGDMHPAHQFATAAKHMFDDLGDKTNEAVADLVIAEASRHIHGTRPTGSAASATASTNVRESDTVKAATSSLATSIQLLIHDQPEAAAQECWAAINKLTGTPYVRFLANAFLQLARIRLASNRWVAAHRLAHLADDMFRKLQDHVMMAHCALLAALALAGDLSQKPNPDSQKQMALATLTFDFAQRVLEQHGCMFHLAMLHQARGILQLNLGACGEAARSLARSFEVLEQLQLARQEIEAANLAALAYFSSRDFGAAAKYLLFVAVVTANQGDASSAQQAEITAAAMLCRAGKVHNALRFLKDRNKDSDLSRWAAVDKSATEFVACHARVEFERLEEALILLEAKSTDSCDSNNEFSPTTADWLELAYSAAKMAFEHKDVPNAKRAATVALALVSRLTPNDMDSTRMYEISQAVTAWAQ